MSFGEQYDSSARSLPRTSTFYTYDLPAPQVPEKPLTPTNPRNPSYDYSRAARDTDTSSAHPAARAPVARRKSLLKTPYEQELISRALAARQAAALEQQLQRQEDERLKPPQHAPNAASLASIHSQESLNGLSRRGETAHIADPLSPAPPHLHREIPGPGPFATPMFDYGTQQQAGSPPTAAPHDAEGFQYIPTLLQPSSPLPGAVSPLPRRQQPWDQPQHQHQHQSHQHQSQPAYGSMQAGDGAYISADDGVGVGLDRYADATSSHLGGYAPSRASTGGQTYYTPEQPRGRAGSWWRPGAADARDVEFSLSLPGSEGLAGEWGPDAPVRRYIGEPGAGGGPWVYQGEGGEGAMESGWGAEDEEGDVEVWEQGRQARGGQGQGRGGPGVVLPTARSRGAVATAPARSLGDDARVRAPRERATRRGPGPGDTSSGGSQAGSRAGDGSVSTCGRVCVVLVVAHVLALLGGMAALIALVAWPEAERAPEPGEPVVVVSQGAATRRAMARYAQASFGVVSGTAFLVLLSTAIIRLSPPRVPTTTDGDADAGCGPRLRRVALMLSLLCLVNQLTLLVLLSGHRADVGDWFAWVTAAAAVGLAYAVMTLVSELFFAGLRGGGASQVAAAEGAGANAEGDGTTVPGDPPLSASDEELLDGEERTLGSLAVVAYELPVGAGAAGSTAGSRVAARVWARNRAKRVKEAPLSRAQVARYTKLSFYSRRAAEGAAEEEDDACAICLCGFEDGDADVMRRYATLRAAAPAADPHVQPRLPAGLPSLLRVLPCFHAFHAACCESHLTTRPTCPLCRTHVVLAGRAALRQAQEKEADAWDDVAVPELEAGCREDLLEAGEAADECVSLRTARLTVEGVLGAEDPAGGWVRGRPEGEWATLLERARGVPGMEQLVLAADGPDEVVAADELINDDTEEAVEAGTPSALRRHRERMSVLVRLQRRQFLETRLLEQSPGEASRRGEGRRGTAEIVRRYGLMVLEGEARGGGGVGARDEGSGVAARAPRNEVDAAAAAGAGAVEMAATEATSTAATTPRAASEPAASDSPSHRFYTPRAAEAEARAASERHRSAPAAPPERSSRATPRAPPAQGPEPPAQAPPAPAQAAAPSQRGKRGRGRAQGGSRGRSSRNRSRRNSAGGAPASVSLRSGRGSETGSEAGAVPTGLLGRRGSMSRLSRG